MIPKSANETGGEVSSSFSASTATVSSLSFSDEVLEAASSFPSGAGEPEVEASSGEGIVEGEREKEGRVGGGEGWEREGGEGRRGRKSRARFGRNP